LALVSVSVSASASVSASVFLPAHLASRPLWRTVDRRDNAPQDGGVRFASHRGAAERLSQDDRRRWNRRHRAGGRTAGAPLKSLAALEPVLRAHAGLCRGWARAGGEERGPARALDLACGLGRNALFLAGLGYALTAVDVSDEALQRLSDEARRRRLAVETLWADLDEFRPPRAGFDLVVDTYFLDRRLWPSMEAALRPGGLIFVETFTVDRRFPPDRAVPRAYLLERGELARAFPRLDALLYREDEQSGVATLLAADRRLDPSLRHMLRPPGESGGSPQAGDRRQRG
jgi:tellurite methyltransferase